MSRGKLIEIHFSETGKISGANIQTCSLAGKGNSSSELFFVMHQLSHRLRLLGLFHVAKLIGCDIEDLKLTLSTRKMKVAGGK
ncbi:hypothetical protein LR48_Vigan241s000100 [Vigna angularis]|uniref:Myosin motor domain-containing protein n=1 Tax=Phaseolus angularis TaxID=3914 RepID=A0A0L9T6P0_PHAAN|nr:hypothetical protein LR48_Vigan241s000100 [Vigna angularis]